MQSRRISCNLIANIFGNAWSAVMGLAFVPLYIKFMGVEAYGLIGIFVSLQAIFAVLDLGLSQTLAREMARLSVLTTGRRQMADIAQTLEIIYWVFALLVGSILALCANFIANFWLKPDQLSFEAIRNALWIMALVIALRWPLTLYIGGMNGLQRQVSLNVLLAFFATFQGVGAVLVLWLLAPSIETFFIWQAFSSALQVLAIRHGFWRAMPVIIGRFSLSILNGVWRFALSMTGISLLAAVLTQLDKLILSRMLSLEQFGFYVFASTVASVLFRVVSPIFTAFLPRYTQLVSSGDYESLKSDYRRGGQIMALALVPAGCVLALFSQNILMLWTQNEELVRNSYVLVGVLVLGNMFNGFVNIPYAIQLAYGWTRLALVQNVLAVIVVVPALFFAVRVFGGLGAAMVWVGLNFLFLVFGVSTMHRKLLVGEGRHWYFQTVICPLVIGATVALLAFFFVPMPHGMIWVFILLTLIFLVVLFSVFLSLPIGRHSLSLLLERVA